MWQTDLPIEITAAVVALLVNVDRLAEDLQIWSTQEFHLVELADGYARGSVIMPQKKNPYSLAYIRGLTSVTIGHLVAMANVGRTPSGQPDNRIFAYGDVPRVIEQAIGAIQLMTGVVSTLFFNGRLMAERVGLGYCQATDLADIIMLNAGLPYETAHRVVGHLVANALETGVPSDRITTAMIDEAAMAVIGRGLGLPPDAVEDVLDPVKIVATRTGLGGAAPSPMNAMIADCHERLRSVGVWRQSSARCLAEAESRLLGLAQELVACPT
jgi:argininosuccinate lyase